jgi:uncharacterized protein (TIGR03437 family)
MKSIFPRREASRTSQLLVGSAYLSYLFLSSNITLAQTPQTITVVAVTNSADFQPGLPQRGSLASIFVTGLVGRPGIVSNAGNPLSNTLNGISVTIDSSPAPILAIAFESGYQQINVQVPWDLQSEPSWPCDVQCGSAVVEVAQNGVRAQSKADFTGLKLFYPSIFFSDTNGYGIFKHADYSFVTPQNPAHPGEYIVGYGINLGPASNTPPTGTPALADPVSISIPVAPVCSIKDTVGAGAPLLVGLAPGTVGVYQINFQVPTSIATGDVPIGFGRQVALHYYSDFCGFSGLQILTELSRTVLLPVH